MTPAWLRLPSTVVETFLRVVVGKNVRLDSHRLDAVARGREETDWDVDRAGARGGELKVAEALRAHPLLCEVDDRSGSAETPDFRFTLDGRDVLLELKEKKQHYDVEIAAVWPDVPEPELVLVDERSLRQLVWAEGVGHLLIADRPQRRWVLFGPWELWLAPRRRYERPNDDGVRTSLKGKILFDARTAASTTAEFNVDALIEVVRRSRLALGQIEAFEIRGRGPLPMVPRLDRSTAGGVRHPQPLRRTAPVPTPSTPVPEDADDGDWCGLSAGMVAEVRRRWGWGKLTGVQRVAIPAILDQRSTLVLGPTAGGKTEAAMLPLLDRWQLEGWRADRPSILCLSPLKALLDDQLERWQRATALVGASAFAWHGDVSADEKRAFRAEPADVLLSTPESLEWLLSTTDDRGRLAGVRAVVIDEAHAFVGHPRGAQVASLLERLEAIAENDIQRIALSATVSNSDAVVAWLRGRSLREAGAVDGGRATIGEVMKIRTHGSLDEAVSTIAEEASGRRCLVFAGSRRRVEELALGLSCAAHHSSVSGDRRADALSDLRTGAVDMVVTSASLEMGIDVGDLDLVIHDGPPPGPSSYLQRLGRAGRSSGHRAITFLVGTPDDLLLVLANVLRARREDLDPMDPKRGARLILGQQALLFTFQQAISTRQEMYETLRFSPVFANLSGEIAATIDHLIGAGFLAARGGMLTIGAEGHRRYGGKVRDLLATFTGSTDASVVDEQGNPVGEVDWSLVQAQDAPVRRDGLVLAGRRWRVVAVHDSTRRVVVSPGGSAAARGWRGSSIPVSRATWAAAQEVLLSTEVPSDSDARGDEWLAELRHVWRLRLATPISVDEGGVVAHTFAGDEVHRAVLRALDCEGKTEGPTLRLSAKANEVRSRASAVLGDLGCVLDAEAVIVADLMPVAHRALCAREVLVAEAREFEIDATGIESVLTLLATWPS